MSDAYKTKELTELFCKQQELGLQDDLLVLCVMENPKKSIFCWRSNSTKLYMLSLICDVTGEVIIHCW